MKKGVVWFKNDLRVNDHEALFKASETCEVVYPVYIFDPREIRTTSLGFSKTGGFRYKFIRESVLELRDVLRSLGGELIIRTGRPEEIIPEIALQVGASAVFTAKETGTEELTILDQLELKLSQNQIALHTFWMHTLYHEEDVPWPIKQVPEVFTSFRKESEKSVEVRPMFPAPKSFHVITDIEAGEIPNSWDVEVEYSDNRGVLEFKGGSKAGQERLNHYLWKTDAIRTYKETRNNLLGADYSSKFSPWLAIGAISAKEIYFELKKYEAERVKNSSTYWLFFELLWRDFFRFMAKKHGPKIYQLPGLHDIPVNYSNDLETFERWRSGETGEPFVDANMEELNRTGFMSNRGRQNVASYLIHDLGVNWTWGAMWFENRLIDYDSSSNWLNWAYIAGVGNDPQKGRKFNIESQTQRYDPKGAYIDRWLKSRPNFSKSA